MSAYPDAEGARRVAFDDLHAVVAATFAACGMEATDAALLAETLAVADLRGVHSHGVLRVPEYVAKLATEGVDPRGRPRMVSDRGAALVVDGGNAMGQIAAAFAMERAIERAGEIGVASAAVRGSNHCGAMAWFAMMALPARMIGIAATNALPTMAPWGGTEKIVGINPLAVAIPAGEERAIVLDTAFAGSAHGKIRVYHRRGLPIPDDWAFDHAGRPTTDAAEAIDGLLQPIGKFKGVGLAMVTGMLSTMLSGAAYGTRLGNMVDGPRAGADGHFLLALDVAAFTQFETFATAVDDAVREIRGSARAEGVERLHAPGGVEAETEARYRTEGIPLDAATLEGLAAAARDRGVDASALERG